MSSFIKQSNPIRIPVPGNKLIEEHFGKAAGNSNDFSLAHMVAPAHWGEPPQTPEFDEITIMLRGKMLIEMNNESITLQAGESFLAKRGHTVRYSNPFDEESEYWAVCIPAFSPELAGRNE